MVKLLAAKGANLSVKNDRGLTLLSTLTGRGEAANSAAASNTRRSEVLHPSTADLLRKLGAVE